MRFGADVLSCAAAALVLMALRGYVQGDSWAYFRTIEKSNFTSRESLSRVNGAVSKLKAILTVLRKATWAQASWRRTLRDTDDVMCRAV